MKCTSLVLMPLLIYVIVWFLVFLVRKVRLGITGIAIVNNASQS
jgi:hypothetical protein